MFRRFRFAGIVVVLALGAGATFVGCGSSTKTVTQAAAKTVTQTSTRTVTSKQPAKAPSTAAPSSQATVDTTGADTTAATPSSSGGGAIPSVPVGTGQTLSADQENDQIDTTVTAVQDLAPDQFDTPDAGKHYVGVFLKLHNLGNTTFDDSPDNDVTLITNADNTISSDIANVGGCSNNGDLKVGAGETLRTCVVFQEPNDQSAKAVQVSLDSGNDPPGEWTRG